MNPTKEKKEDVNLYEGNDEKEFLRMSPKKYQPSSRQKLQNTIKLIDSDNDADWTKAINCLMNNPEYITSEIIPRIFQIGSSEDNEMQLLVLEFLKQFVDGEDSDFGILIENNICDFLSQFLDLNDTFLYSYAIEILQKLCDASEDISKTIFESSLVENSYSSAELAIQTMESFSGDNSSDEFLEYCYIVEGTLRILQHYLPKLEKEMFTLLIALLSSPNQTQQTMSLDFIYYFSIKCSDEYLDHFIEMPAFNTVLNNHLLSTDLAKIRAGLFVIQSFISRNIEYIRHFMEVGLARLLASPPGMTKNESILFFKILIKLAEYDSSDYIDVLKSEAIIIKVNNAIAEGESFQLSKPAIIFVCTLGIRDDAIAAGLIEHIIEYYYKAIEYLTQLMQECELSLQSLILRFFVALINFIIGRDKEEATKILQALKFNEIIEGIESILENNNINDEMYETCHQIIDILQEYE
ncbi:hypothetical protein TVAG_462710 [Trichomonas vaginalis G3]|uniref:Uncharacterized protein n=1 Tax=Trichomonas vaginalis (strain ATCC PRA-98 / G3) TaxID=412133 RepID=A2DLY2_TRIV3|nr:armadillo (ARM) repeat-containing protein family [Trichomonas vaginalis G3]EAY18585.1 hypothetical protein TVAG_462710 [Trichomonas vaginalis G3]KAI5491613.1 armadillo (ARM) repeat-containing protein family [Trichomonas vaginalis G3]|eukprot:XP_001579571.1 hypothetical protein [Trichomonas vaginalis G3]